MNNTGTVVLTRSPLPAHELTLRNALEAIALTPHMERIPNDMTRKELRELINGMTDLARETLHEHEEQWRKRTFIKRGQ